MESRGVAAKRVWQELREAREDDLHFRDARIFASMCTEPIPIAKRAHAAFLEANLGNPGLYKGTWRLEREVLRMLERLLHGRNLGGFTVSGATEGNITALWMARNTTKRKSVVAAKTAHFSIRKAVDLLGMRLVEVGHDSAYRMDLGAVRRAVTKDTAAVVGVAGTTELGQVDPIEELGEVCEDRTFLHVDAAFGGFVLPFLDRARVTPWDFRVAGVSSLVLDAHKMGMATIPASHLLVREASHFAKIAVESPYLTSVYQTSLLGTRNSAGVAAAYAAMRTLGRDGYRKIVARCMRNTRTILARAREAHLEPAIEPVMNVLAFPMKDVEAVQRALDARGWKVSTSRNPRALRVVVMPHITAKAAAAFGADLAAVCKRLGVP
ncbi:MAG TPA: tyrosine decarboxylase MfnA [Thermoplasmata archaeon]|jgi:tyrosine decarboxylase/aspartate 1-decarboxylase|nr:tyrosine decarboxylase MfnA [Thermoplasmata archaeon]